MEKKAAKPVAKPTVKQQSKPGIPKSAVAVAAALVKHYPKDADGIVKVMSTAATSASLKKKLARVQRALGFLRKEGA